MNIRLMQLDDYEKVYHLWLSCKGMGLNNLDDSRDGIEKYLIRNPDTCFVVEEAENIVGAIMSGHDGRRGTIYHTAVHPDYQRRGIGKKLVEEALEALKRQNIHKVNLDVFRRNEDGNAFWERMGFTARPDLVFRNRALTEMERIDT